MGRRASPGRKVGVHRVNVAIGLDGVYSRAQRPSQHLPTKHLPPAQVLTLTAKQVLLDALQSQ